MSPRHAAPRARIAFSYVAAAQVDKLSEREIHSLDRALVALSVNPELGEVIPDSSPELREYLDLSEGVRVIYHVTVMRTVVVVAYVEV